MVIADANSDVICFDVSFTICWLFCHRKNDHGDRFVTSPQNNTDTSSKLISYLIKNDDFNVYI